MIELRSKLLPRRQEEGGLKAVRRLGDEGIDLTLTVDDEAHGYRLHTPCRERGADTLPEHRRELEAHDTVEDTACLLGID